MASDWAPLDNVVGAVTAEMPGGIEFRQVLGRQVEGDVHSTPDGRDWVAVQDSFPAGGTAATPFLRWRLLRRWSRPIGSLVPPAVLAEVEEALSLFARPGSTRHEQLRRAARGALPPVHFLGALLEDAWSVLQGDREAVVRFRDAVDFLSGVSSPNVERGRGLLDDFLSGDEAHREELLREPVRPREGSGVCPEHEVLLILAAFQVVGDRFSGSRYASVIHDQVCAYDTLYVLHSAAVRALAGDAAASAALWAQLCLLGGVQPEAVPSSSGLPLRPPPSTAGPIAPFPSPVFERHPWPPFRGFDRCVLIAVKNLHVSENRYLVTAVTPARACPGESITITGSGFGATPGTVRFRRRGTPPGSSTIAVPAQSWSDTTVVVTVPPDAGWGVQLVLPVASWQACGSVVELFKQGQFLADYIGGAPDVMSFSAAGVHSLDEAPQACTIEPSTFTVTWDVRAADHVMIQVTAPDGWRGGVDPAPSVGSYRYDASGVTRTTPLTVRLVATGSCDPRTVERLITVTVQRTPDLRVHGMEVTQAIQHYRAAEHLTDPGDRGPDNSLRLVADKTAYVRVYLRSGQDPGFDSGELVDVTGTLEVRRFTGGTWAHVVTLSPTPAGARVAAHADPLYPWERGTLAASLNFCVPAGVMFGHLRFEAMVTSPFAIVGGGPTYGSVDVDVTLRQTLKVAGILIGYNGPPGRTASVTAPPLVLPAPQPTDLMSTASWVMRTYPVSESPVFRVVGTFTLTKHLQDPRVQGSCSANWDDLMSALREFADDDGNQPDWLYYGLLPPSTPMGPVVGCGGGAVGTGQNGDGPTMAEELGHGVGLMYHTPCGVSGPSVLSSYPAYEPYDANPQSPIGCIGEYGLDTSTGTVHHPTTADFMGYCRPEWISKHTHERLLNVPALSPVTLSAAAAALVRRPNERHHLQPQAVVALTASLDSTGAVDSVRVRRVITRPDHRGDEPTELVAELLGEEGEVLASATMHALRLCGQAPGRGSDAVPYRHLLKAYVPDVARGARLRLRHGDRELWRRDAPAEPASVREVVAQVTRDRRLDLRWQAAPDARFTAWVRWSDNDGETWRPLTVGLTGQNAVLGLDSLPGGELRFQVVVHDGFESITGTSAPVFVPHRGPAGAVLHPSEGEEIQAGAALRLWGVGVDEYGQSLPSADCQWVLDDHALDPGPDLILDPPPTGPHRAQFVVHDQHGRSVAERSFRVITHASP